MKGIASYCTAVSSSSIAQRKTICAFELIDVFCQAGYRAQRPRCILIFKLVPQDQIFGFWQLVLLYQAGVKSINAVLSMPCTLICDILGRSTTAVITLVTFSQIRGLAKGKSNRTSVRLTAISRILVVLGTGNLADRKGGYDLPLPCRHLV